MREGVKKGSKVASWLQCILGAGGAGDREGGAEAVMLYRVT